MSGDSPVRPSRDETKASGAELRRMGGLEEELNWEDFVNKREVEEMRGRVDKYFIL